MDITTVLQFIKIIALFFLKLLNLIVYVNDSRENVNSFFRTNLCLVNMEYVRQGGHIHIVFGIIWLAKEIISYEVKILYT